MDFPWKLKSTSVIYKETDEHTYVDKVPPFGSETRIKWNLIKDR